MELLPKYSNDPNFVGYPYFYVIDDWKCECHKCASESAIEGKNFEVYANYDDPDLYCFTCSAQIEASNGSHQREEEEND